MSDHMKVSKGLELPVVALPGCVAHARLGRRRAGGRTVFYVAATRACYAEVGDCHQHDRGIWPMTKVNGEQVNHSLLG
jgi:hypothetical protein